MRSTKNKRESTADRIQTAATALFMENGFTRTSIASIEKAAGLAPRTGGFYRHFSSKTELLVAIAEDTIENPDEMGFSDLLPLGDTRAELLLIARGYARAFERRAKLGPLVAEVQNLPEITSLIARVDEELGNRMYSFIAAKPAAQALSRSEVVSLTFTVFGGWVFFLGKHDSQIGNEAIPDNNMLEHWATFWADALDRNTVTF